MMKGFAPLDKVRARNRAVVVGLVAGWALLSGCESGGSGKSGPGGQAVGPGSAAPPQQHQILENVPVPVGFTFIPGRSIMQIVGVTRVGRCEFEGATNPDATARFYLEQMPSARFALRQKRFDVGEYTLRFESDSEECTVRVKPVKDKTMLIVDIGPLVKGGAQREGRPPEARPAEPRPAEPRPEAPPRRQ